MGSEWLGEKTLGFLKFPMEIEIDFKIVNLNVMTGSEFVCDIQKIPTNFGEAHGMLLRILSPVLSLDPEKHSSEVKPYLYRIAP